MEVERSGRPSSSRSCVSWASLCPSSKGFASRPPASPRALAVKPSNLDPSRKYFQALVDVLPVGQCFARGVDIDGVLDQLEQTEILHRDERRDVLPPSLDEHTVGAVLDFAEEVGETIPGRRRLHLDHGTPPRKMYSASDVTVPSSWAVRDREGA